MMAKMECSKSFIVTVVVLLLVGGRLWHKWNKEAHAPIRAIRGGDPALPISDDSELMMNYRLMLRRPLFPTNKPVPPPTPASSNKAPQNLGFRQKANELTDAEKLEMTNLFVTKLKPAVEKWFLVYSNRVPFDLADLSLDKFTDRTGTRIPQYMFVMGDITLTIENYSGTCKVRYWKAAKRFRQ